jgi:hypothetical protein
MLDQKGARLRPGRENAEPHARSAIVCRQADHARVMPKPALDDLRERQAAVAGNDAVNPREGEIKRLHTIGR